MDVHRFGICLSLELVDDFAFLQGFKNRHHAVQEGDRLGTGGAGSLDIITGAKLRGKL